MLERALRCLNLRMFKSIFICVVVGILKERSDLNLPACLDYALPRSTEDSADPSRLFCSFQVCFLSDSLVCYVWHCSLNLEFSGRPECDLMVVCVALACLFTFFVIAWFFCFFNKTDSLLQKCWKEKDYASLVTFPWKAVNLDHWGARTNSRAWRRVWLYLVKIK